MKQILMLFAMICFVGQMHASFPVNKENLNKFNDSVNSVQTADLEVVTSQDLNVMEMVVPAAPVTPVAAADADNTMLITVLLWLFLGGFAAHRWYKKKPAGWNILFILTLGGLGIWWLVDGINILSDNFD